MSTRSRIGIIRQRPEGEAPIVESVYCHFDGYPGGVGKTLHEHWTDVSNIDELLRLGDLSALGEEVGEDQGTGWFDARHETLHGTYDEPRDPADDPRSRWSLFYGRDRGEEGVDSVVHPIDDFPDYGQEAEYVFDPEDGLWRVRSRQLNPVGWNTVRQWDGWKTIPEAIEYVTA
jgi:hypothetical protein